MAAGAFKPITPYDPAIFQRGTVSLPEGNSQTFKKGEPVIFASGLITVAGSAPAVIYGIAAQDAQGDGKRVNVWPLVAGDLWEIIAEDAAAATDPGSTWGLVRDATSKSWFADSADAGDQVTFVLNLGAIIPGEVGAVGDTKFRALFTFAEDNIQGF